MHSKIKNTILKYTEKNITNLDIYFGNNILSNKTNNIIFNKTISKEEFNLFLEKISLLNYKNTIYKQKIYNINSSYLNSESKKHTMKSNINSLFDNNKLYIYYYENECPYHSFPSNKNYNIIEQHINKYTINNEIDVLFINNDQIKISLIINHNIDHSIKQIEHLFTLYV